MGIKNIHIFLISCSVVVAVIFGFWALGHAYPVLGGLSLAAAAGLAIYGVNFLKKTKNL